MNWSTVKYLENDLKTCHLSCSLAQTIQVQVMMAHLLLLVTSPFDSKFQWDVITGCKLDLLHVCAQQVMNSGYTHLLLDEL